MSIYLGIDFGTSTNYVTRWYEDGSVKAVPNMDPSLYTGDEVFPNVIYYQNSGNSIIGKSAAKFLAIDPRNGVAGVKRRLVEDNWEYTIPAISAKSSPVDVATDIFSYIKKRVSENNGGAGIDGVVISVPYAYGNKERLKIQKAAERAGLNVLDLIEEPVAAAISYGVFQKQSTMGHSENIMVFDFGGGTLDITVFSYSKTPEGKVTIEVLNTEGLRDFGGQLIDELLMTKITEKAQVNISEIKDEEQRLKFQSEMLAKVVEIKEAYQYWEEDEEEDIDDIISGIRVLTSVSTEELEGWIRGAGIIEKIRFAVEDALIDSGDSGLDKEDIDRVLLVGGSSNLKIVKRELEELFGKEPEECDTVEINKMVGHGAGVYCGMKVKNNSEISIVQKLSYSIGVRVGAKFDKLIEKNETYGTFSKPRKYALADNKNHRDIEVYQGNSTDIKKCFLIGKIPVSDLSLDAGQEIEIELGTDKSGMVAYKVFVAGRIVTEGQIE